MNNNVPSSLELFKTDGLGVSGQKKIALSRFDSANNSTNNSANNSNGNQGTNFSDSLKEASQAFDTSNEKVANTANPAQSSGLELDSKLADNNIVGDISSTPVNLSIDELLLSEHPIIVDAFTDISLAEPLESDLASSLEDVLSMMQQVANGGEINDSSIEDLKSLVGPEQFSNLMSLFGDGKKLPLEHNLPLTIDTVKQALLSPLDPKLQQFNQSTIPNNLKLNSLTEALQPVAEPLKPLANVGKGFSPELFSLDTDILQNTTKGLLPEGVIEKALTEGLLESHVKADTLSSRLASDLTLNQASSTHAAPLLSKAQLSVTIPFQQAQWGEAVAERVMWMSSQGVQEAEIFLDPPELGPLQVKVSVVNEQAHVSFVVQHGSVREALDQNAMRLREMFEAEGIELADVDVSDQSEQHAESEAQQGGFDKTPIDNDDEALITETAITSSGNLYSLVNTYA